jgi:hypothetical protein
MHLHLDNKNQFEIKICVHNIFESDFVKDIMPQSLYFRVEV